MYTDAAMFHISDVNITDEFLRGDSETDFSLLPTFARLLCGVVAPLRGKQDTKALGKAPCDHSFPADR